jgi:hypothetical protein
MALPQFVEQQFVKLQFIELQFDKFFFVERHFDERHFVELLQHRTFTTSNAASSNYFVELLRKKWQIRKLRSGNSGSRIPKKILAILVPTYLLQAYF